MPVTLKPAETGMGSGMGNPVYWVAVVMPGRILFELGGVREDLAEEALMRAIHKLPMKCRIVKRETVGAAAATESADTTPAATEAGE
jgi:large subunit ribosomal protein L16